MNISEINNQQNQKYISGLDAFRTLAIIGVTLFHMFPEILSGGYFGLGEDAPDGHEATCLMYYYDCMDDYYYKRGICKQCGSRDITWLEADNRESMKCWDCGYRMYKDW